ncbi:AbrB/MazE/SpoVT family DNA-binding domain-containing protein [Clostridium baratii]|uniref:AbrB/MazE/SpoVT family DNA-binding domain-containing protein n=1 Tax=Clostridium baratii TaxID=1561 RepID=UPI00294217DB|nr:AbrB/MazE/SpoVT family DNA-binding domain-containing protein [Clostridium baratii]
MEKRELKISFNKSGRGSITPKMTLPAVWIKEMGINIENREVEVVFENKEIIIRKKG